MRDYAFLAAGIALVLAAALGWLVLNLPSPAAPLSCGVASFYGAESGNRTANGEHFDPAGLTAASRDLRFGSHVRVTDVATGRSVVVRIDDRGPAAWTHRLIDLSRGAAARLGIINRGVALVCLSSP